MNRKKTLLIALTVITFGVISIQAQEAVSTGGGNASGTGGTVSYTIGQVAYTTQSGSGDTITQGVQQPFEIFVVTALEQAKDITLQFLVYPNPVSEYVKLEVENYKIENLSYQLYDVNGKLLVTSKIENSETSITMSSLASGTYLLDVFQSKTNINTFKIIKK